MCVTTLNANGVTPYEIWYSLFRLICISKVVYMLNSYNVGHPLQPSVWHLQGPEYTHPTKYNPTEHILALEDVRAVRWNILLCYGSRTHRRRVNGVYTLQPRQIWGMEITTKLKQAETYPVQETEGNGQVDANKEQPSDTVSDLELQQEHVDLDPHSVKKEQPDITYTLQQQQIHVW